MTFWLQHVTTCPNEGRRIPKRTYNSGDTILYDVGLHIGAESVLMANYAFDIASEGPQVDRRLGRRGYLY